MPVARRIIGDSVALTNDMLDYLFVEIMDKELRQKITVSAFERAKNEFVTRWDRYISSDLRSAGYISSAMVTRLPGHPKSGEELVETASAKNTFELRKAAGEYPSTGGKGTRGLIRWSYRMFKVSELDKITTDGNTAVIPYWSLFEWGSGRRMVTSEAPPWADREYPHYSNVGLTTSQSDSYDAYWVWYPKQGIGHRGQGAIIAFKKRPKTKPTYLMEDFPPGGMFRAAAYAFNAEFQRQAGR